MRPFRPPLDPRTANTTIAAGDTTEEIDKLRRAGDGHIVVWGRRGLLAVAHAPSAPLNRAADVHDAWQSGERHYLSEGRMAQLKPKQ